MGESDDWRDPSGGKTLTPRESLELYKAPIIMGLLSLLAISGAIALLVKSVSTRAPIRFSSDSGTLNATSSGQAAGVMVDVAGAVVRPGVYQLAAASRVEDALIAAGGLSANADNIYVAKNINRAKPLTDGMKLYVPRVGEVETSYNNTSGIEPTGSGTGQDNEPTVSINDASLSELDSLPGVGPVTAQKIVNSRPYLTIDELVIKKAISQSLFTKLRARLSL